MSADIIPFAPHRNRTHGVIKSGASEHAPDDLVMDHVDTSPCEYVGPDEHDPIFAENTDA